MPIKNDQMFLDAIKGLKKKNSKLNRAKLLEMAKNYVNAWGMPDGKNKSYSFGQKELRKYLYNK